MPSVNDVPATGIEYRFRLFNSSNAQSGLPMFWVCSLLTGEAVSQPWDGDISGYSDDAATQIAEGLLSFAPSGGHVKVDRRWTFSAGSNGFQDVAQVPPPEE